MKLTSLCIAKEIINTTKRQPTAWEKKNVPTMQPRGLIYKIDKELIQLNKKQT